MTTILYKKNGLSKKIEIPNKTCPDPITAKIWLVQALELTRVTIDYMHLEGNENKLLSAGIDPKSIDYFNT